jgi:hypothetical protein
LTDRQTAIVRCITEAVLRQGYPPSRREIGQAVELTSTSSVAFGRLPTAASPPSSTAWRLREEAGDRDGAEALARQAADRGNARDPDDRLLTMLWPNGLDPDGTPTTPWQP